MGERASRDACVAVSVVIPVHNGSETLPRCLSAIGASSFERYEAIVADDGSTDGSAEVAERFGCRVVRLAERGGAARARNAGARCATGDVLFFTDADVILPPDALQRVWDVLGSRREVAAVQGIYRSPGLHSDAPSRYQNDYYHYFCKRIKGDRTSVFATWCVAVRRDAFWDVGGFDSRIAGATVEDEELGYELVDRGYHILLDRGLLVDHLAHYSLMGLLSRRFHMAQSQMKSALRKAAVRLFRRYANVGRNMTHHSRKTLLSIPLSFFVLGFMVHAAVSRTPSALLWALGGWAALVLLASEFLRHVVVVHGLRALLPTLALFWLDMLAVGCGLVVGGVQYALGRRF